MKDHGMIFSPPMVKALIAGIKTQTRRILSPSHVTIVSGGGLGGDPIRTYRPTADGLAAALTNAKGMRSLDGLLTWHQDNEGDDEYGVVRRIWMARIRPAIGDRAWVRETWGAKGTGVWTIADARRQIAPDQRIVYIADSPDDGPWWPSIHMPRVFSRITLTITDVRVQKLQEITEEDAIAEGLTKSPEDRYFIDKGAQYCGGDFPTARQCYAHLWDSLHGGDGKRWKDNPWIAALTFSVELRNIDSPGLEPARQQVPA